MIPVPIVIHSSVLFEGRAIFIITIGMTSQEIREKFLTFYKDRGHTVVPSSSLVPEDDSSVLFTTAGMQQFKPYYTGARDANADFNSQNTTSVQKCVRTSDIEEVGDDTHLTFFEMLGNFSFGGYFKEEAIKSAHEFITEVMGLEIDYVSVFEGDKDVPRDDESEEIWKSLDANIDVREFGREDNFWGPTGSEGPCGPTTEVYVNDVEVWNIVFNEFYKDADGNYTPLEQKGVDTGMGLERLLVQKNKVNHIYQTDLFKKVLDIAHELTDSDEGARVIADHMRTALFMIADGVTPSNTDRGYILRRLIRRSVMKTTKRTLSQENISDILDTFVDIYGGVYEKLDDPYVVDNVRGVIYEEVVRFENTIEKGMKEFERLSGSDISGADAFVLFSTYGFPLELTLELAQEKGIKVDTDGFKAEEAKHQEESRTASAGMFKGGLADHSEMSVKYHTATHLLLAALREVLGDHVEQKGSNINEKRLRLDFSNPEKLTDEQKSKVEEWVNDKISKEIDVTSSEMSLDEAKAQGALGVFGDKYGETVSVYRIEDVSLEICGGPHVENTGVLGTFRIKKEESVSAGVRRIKAVLE